MGSAIQGKPKPLSLAVRSHLLLTLGLVSLSPLAVADNGAQKWACHADASGQWVCDAFSSAAPAYERPVHRETSTEPTPGETRLSITRNLDWVDENQLTEQEKAAMRPNCCGAYIEPKRDYPDADSKPEESPIRVSATTTEAQGNVAILEGDVQVSQGYRQVRSNRAVVDQAARTVELEGNVNFREPGMLLTGDHADINMDSGEVDIDSAEFVIHDSGIRGSAGNLSRKQDGIIYIDNATYTTCEPDNNAWLLKATDVDIDRARNHVTAKNVRLNIRDVPVLYIPWIRFPASNDRATGLLFPTLASGNDNGLDYAQPIYLNLAPNYDATITPRYIQHRGAMVETEFRHLATWGTTSLAGGYLASDDGGDIAREPAGSKLPHEGDDRWIVNLDHSGKTWHNIHTRVDYTDVSDEDYFRDLDATTLEVNSRSHLNQEAGLGYSTGNWDFGVKAQQFETLIIDGVEQYKQLPRFDANGYYRFDSSDLVLSLRQHVVRFDHSDDDIFGTGTALTQDDLGTTITGSRLRADYSLTWDKEWLWGFFRPSAMVKAITYNLDNPLQGYTDDSPNAVVPVATVDTGIYLERETNWFKGHIQTLEPRLYYLNSRFEDQSGIPNFDTKELTFDYQQLFRDDRFSGGDRIGDTEQFTLGVTSRLMNAENGKERVRFSIGQIFYLDDRKVTLTQNATELLRDESNIAAEFSTWLGDFWRLQNDILVDDKARSVEKGSAALRYNNRDNTLFNLAYRYTRQGGSTGYLYDIDQLDLSFALPVSDNWKVLGRYNQDLGSGQDLEIFAGLEYSSCCWSTAFVARRWVDRDDSGNIISIDDLDHQSGIFFQVQFKGLAGTGTRVANILKDGIYGYQVPEN